MMEIRKTEVYARWIDGLRDIRARARILARVERLAMGDSGDFKPIGEGISELRINFGPGYRVYYTQRGREIIILLAGGDKSSQARDIKNALRLARVGSILWKKQSLLDTTSPSTFERQRKWLLILKPAWRRLMGMLPSLRKRSEILRAPKACPRWRGIPDCPAKVYTRHYRGNELPASTQFSKS